ncbi:hypothetical protein ABWH91_02485 [Phycisphaerales bacterium ac7]
MARLPRHPEAFAEHVRAILARMKPELHIELTGPTELIVEGRRLDLENLHRLVTTDEDRGVEIVEQYLDHLFDDETFSVGNMPWEMAATRIIRASSPPAFSSTSPKSSSPTCRSSTTPSSSSSSTCPT